MMIRASEPPTKVLRDLSAVFDESAIEAEAIRTRAAELEQLERLLASLESRRDKALRRIVEYRGEFGRHVRRATDRMIEGGALALEGGSGEPRAA
jgi:hypothetical protein